MNVHVESVSPVRKKNSVKASQRSAFGADVFDLRLITSALPQKTIDLWMEGIEGRKRMDVNEVELIAEALKNWAIAKGATHYTHWFQPLTGAVAEKHDSFLSWKSLGSPIKQLRGKELMQGEPDASSFPSGGLRSTPEARGYTVWDTTSAPFIWSGADGVTLCIPALFFSWSGEALDHKIPLLRSEQKMEEAVLRLLSLVGHKAKKVFSTLGAEQEYFLIDREIWVQRPDLQLTGRTLFGAKCPKGQELEEHYFSSIDDRVLSFMVDVEERAIRLGIPVKTRHNEVAPAQHEVAPLFEKSPLAVDHNLLLMELMRSCAAKHHLACLFHEKPFEGINGSGKHNNWSLGTDTGLNVLNPEKNSLVFLTTLAAILRAVHLHAALLRSSVASAGNDHRLGGSEAPPTILSVYLGQSLEKLVSDIAHDRIHSDEVPRYIDLGLSHIAPFQADLSDRNRTSFFAFTGNKFEFRAVGSSASCAWPITTIQAIVTESLQLIVDEMELEVAGVKDLELQLKKGLPLLRKHFKEALPVLFGGNGYSTDWEKEAENRGLPNIRKSCQAFEVLLDKRSIHAFEGILTQRELEARYEVSIERYAKTVQIEINLMLELFRTQILPAALTCQEKWARSINALTAAGIKPGVRTLDALESLSAHINEAIGAIDEVERVTKQTQDLGFVAKAKVFSDLVSPKMEEARRVVDKLEMQVEHALWPLPTYREILYSVW